jgi:hypothetical protein
LRKQMRRLKDLNWSAIVRDAIELRINLEKKQTERDWSRVREADKVANEIFEEMHRKYGHVDYDSTETIRSWRAKRYGSTR